MSFHPSPQPCMSDFRRWIMAASLAGILTSALLSTDAAAADQPMRVVGTGGRIGVGAYKQAGTVSAYWQRTPHVLGGPVAEITIGFMNWLHVTSGEAANPSPVTIEYAWLERGATGQVVPLTFSGQRQLVMPANDEAAYHLADPIPSSVWQGTPPSRDEVFWVHAKGGLPAGGSLPIGTPATYTGARFLAYDGTKEPGAKDVAGPLPNIPGANARPVGLPLLFLGRFTEPGNLSVIGIGDSILFGMGDAENPVPVISGFGFFNRAAVDEKGANAIAMLNLTRSGETAATWVAKHERQAKLLPFANVVVEEFGTNDIGSNGSKSNPQAVYARVQSVWKTAREAGVQKIVRTRLMPRASSVDRQWASASDQTPNPGWGPGETRDQVNDLLAKALAEGKIDILVDTLTPVADPGNTHLWITNGTKAYATGDGTHPRRAGYALLATPLREALLKIKVDEAAPSSR